MEKIALHSECVFYSKRSLLKQMMEIKAEIIDGLYKIGYLEVCSLSCWDCHGCPLEVSPESKPLRRTWSSLASMYTQASGGRRQRSPTGAARRKGCAASAGKQQISLKYLSKIQKIAAIAGFCRLFFAHRLNIRVSRAVPVRFPFQRDLQNAK